MAGGVVIRNADLDEAALLTDIDRACWPSGIAADEAKFRARIQAYPQGQWAAEQDGKLVGQATAQRITSAFWQSGPIEFDRLTDNGRFTGSHDPEGELFQLISVSVLPEARGSRLGRRLVDHEIEFARSLPGVRRIIGVTRPIGLHKHPAVSLEEYVTLRRENGRYVDPVLDFHLGAGARVVSIHPNYRPADTEALGYGILIEYPV